MFALRLINAYLLVVALYFVGFSDSAASGGDNRTQVLIYYGNETSQAAVRSANYATLLATLKTTAGSMASRLLDNILLDSIEFPAAVRRDAEVLLAATQRRGADIVIFTNDLALDGRYRTFRSKVGRVEDRGLPTLPPTHSPILETSPLSRPEFLRLALQEVASLYPKDTIDAVLIVNSHGGEEMILMPRVNTDLSSPGAADFLARQLREERTEDDAPAWAALKGTNKLTFWHILSEASAIFGIGFPLVFLESCESGMGTWTEWKAIPASVQLIAHSGAGEIFPAKIDYAPLLAKDGPSDWITQLEAGLQSYGVYVGRPWTLVFWVIQTSLQSIWLGFYLFPLAGWLIWSAARSLLAQRTFQRLRLR